MNRQGRYIRVLSVWAVSLALFAACGDGGTDSDDGANAPATTVPEDATDAVDATDTPTTTTTAAPDDGVVVEVEVRDGAVVGGTERVEVSVGDAVSLRVSADVTDHVHVHGYDLFADVTPDQPAVVEFEADIPGVFEVELEDRRLPVVELLVR